MARRDAVLWLAVTAALAGCDDGHSPQAAAITMAVDPAGLVFTLDPGDHGPQSPTSRQQLFTIGLDGADAVQLTDDGLNRFLPHFSPDGQAILFTTFFRGGYGSADASPTS